MSRILAIDYGTKRIGLAISDETKTIAIPKSMVPAKQFKKLTDYIKENKVERILLGLPKNLKGEETSSAKAARQFGLKLQKHTHLPLEYIDERFTTKEAQRKLKDLGLREKESKAFIDSMSAYIILQSYLKKLRN